jgi:hypothetical protein
MLIFGIVILSAVAAAYIFMQGAQFGSFPKNERLKRILHSRHYHDGQFHNLSPTPQLTEGANFFSVLRDFLFNKTAERVPPAPLPSVKTDLKHLDPDKNLLVWFGHSSYFIQIDGKKILVDPVFSGNASPLSFTTKSFKGTDVYNVADMPDIDYLFITHDHWDHLDYKTVLTLKPKVKKVITSLGAGAHLESWGYNKSLIEEMDWNDQIIPGKGFLVNAVTARHFSGRGFKRNATLWSSFVLTTPSKKILIGGDSGYDSHFIRIGKEFGPFDLVML